MGIELEAELVQVNEGQCCLRPRIAWVEVDSPFHQLPYFQVFGRRNLSPHLSCAEKQIIGSKAFGSLGQGLLSLNVPNTHAESSGDLAGQSVLYRKNVPEVFVVRAGPDVASSPRVDKLRGNSDLVCGATSAALQDVTHTQLSADLPHIWRLASVLKGCVSGDHEQFSEVGELRDDVLDQPVDEVILGGHPAQVRERQHCDRGLVWQRQGDTVRALPDVCAAQQSHDHDSQRSCNDPSGSALAQAECYALPIRQMFTRSRQDHLVDIYWRLD